MKSSFFFIILFFSKIAYGIRKSNFKFIYNKLKQTGNNATNLPNGDDSQYLEVEEPIIIASYQITEETNLAVDWAYDTWSSASDVAFNDYSNASFSEDQSREQYGISLSVDKKNYGYSLGLSKSLEWDYLSRKASFSLFKRFASDNFGLQLSFNQLSDKLKIYNFLEDQTVDNLRKKTNSIQISIDQIITPELIFKVGLSRTKSSGTLEGTLNSVNLNSVRVNDNLPDQRTRYNYFLEVIQAFNKINSLKFQYSHYNDDWKIKANSFEFTFLREFLDGDGILELGYRNYSQEKYAFFQKNFSHYNAFMTSDADLQKFKSHDFQLGYQHELLILNSIYTIGIRLSKYKREGNLQFSTYQLSAGVNF